MESKFRLPFPSRKGELFEKKVLGIVDVRSHDPLPRIPCRLQAIKRKRVQPAAVRVVERTVRPKDVLNSSATAGSQKSKYD